MPATAVELLVTGVRSPLASVTVGRALLDFAQDVLGIVRARGDRRLVLVLAHAALLEAFRGERERAETLCREAAELAGDPDADDLYNVWAAQNWLRLSVGDLVGAGECFARIIAWASRNGFDFERAVITAGSWLILEQAGLQDASVDDFRVVVELSRRVGAPSAIAMSLAILAQLLVRTDPDAAHASLLEAAEWIEALGPAFVEDATLATIGMVAAHLGEVEIALAAARRALDRGASSTMLLAALLEVVADTVASAAPRGAASLHGAIDVLAPGMEQVFDTRPSAVEHIAAASDPSTIEHDRAAGAQLTAREATDLARTLASRALDETRSSVAVRPAL